MKKLFMFFALCVFAFADMIIGIPGGYKKIFPKIINLYNKTYHKNVKAVYGPMGYLIYQAKIGSVSMIMGERGILTSHGFDNFYPIGKGTLVILSKKNVSNVNDLKKLKLIALPNPKTTIYGKAAKEAFDKLGRKKGFLPVALMPQGINYLLMGNCDGAVANLVQAKFHKKLHYLVIPQKYYSPIVLGFSILSDNRNAQSFLNFVKSPQAQKILKEYGL